MSFFFFGPQHLLVKQHISKYHGILFTPNILLLISIPTKSTNLYETSSICLKKQCGNSEEKGVLQMTDLTKHSEQ